MASTDSLDMSTQVYQVDEDHKERRNSGSWRPMMKIMKWGAKRTGSLAGATSSMLCKAGRRFSKSKTHENLDNNLLCPSEPDMNRMLSFKYYGLMLFSQQDMDSSPVSSVVLNSPTAQSPTRLQLPVAKQDSFYQNDLSRRGGRCVSKEFYEHETTTL